MLAELKSLELLDTPEKRTSNTSICPALNTISVSCWHKYFQFVVVFCNTA